MQKVLISSTKHPSEQYHKGATQAIIFLPLLHSDITTLYYRRCRCDLIQVFQIIKQIDHSGLGDVTDCDNLQFDLDTVYDWASSNNMFFNTNFF